MPAGMYALEMNGAFHEAAVTAQLVQADRWGRYPHWSTIAGFDAGQHIGDGCAQTGLPLSGSAPGRIGSCGASPTWV